MYAAFLNDPPETRTEAFVRAAGSCTEPAEISVTIDNFTVPEPTQYFTGATGSQSPFFNVQLPPDNVGEWNETTVPELVFSPSAEQGYYLFVQPLSNGATPSTGTPRDAPKGASRTLRTNSRWSAAARTLKQTSPGRNAARGQ